MQLAKIAVGSRLSEGALPRAGSVESFGIEGLVIGRQGVRFIVVVDECDAVAYVDGDADGLNLKSLMWNRCDGRKKRLNCGVRAAFRMRASCVTAGPTHVGAYAATGMRGWVEPSETGHGGISKV
jgi:hypothetical protein